MLKIASFDFANLQYFNSTFLNLKIVRAASLECEMRNSCSRSVHVSDCFDRSDKQNIVHLVAYIYMLTSNEEISKIEKTYL